MSFEKKERCLNKAVQRRYTYSHDLDEFELSNGREIQGQQTHEIIFGVGKTFEIWNMIYISFDNHRKCHTGEISKRELFQAKIRNGMSLDEFPDEIIRRFDLVFEEK